jgi:hypothetical protein
MFREPLFVFIAEGPVDDSIEACDGAQANEF